ncbi:peroxiredoxin [Patulibacter sp. SYSU D01012]|uniref:peroxiredoxin n=1 Tax=Patulibacter sp. SYSU D01012 TaxID=2817381 RepID=UPI001B303109|nr:peroxiredoxin [Patulibacter sp. SYSU D01012]
MSSAPRPGEQAPDFTLEGTDGPFTLSAHRGRPVVVAFYPGDDTPVCTKQFCSYRDRADDLAALDAVVVGVSGKDVASKEAFAGRHGLTVPLLADPDGAVAARYGVTSRLTGTKRATFVIDADGRVAWAKVHAVGLTFVTVDELATVLAGLPSRPAA